MQREIEYEVRETKVEELTLCDDCGREVDDDGKLFFEGGDGGNVRYAEQIDLCSECLEDFGVAEPDEPILTVEEWNDRHHGGPNDVSIPFETRWFSLVIGFFGVLVAIFAGGFFGSLGVSGAIFAWSLITIAYTRLFLGRVKKKITNAAG